MGFHVLLIDLGHVPGGDKSRVLVAPNQQE